MTTLRLITAPAIEPITLNDLKLHLRVTEIEERDSGGTEAVIEDSLLNTLIVTARKMIEGLCGPLISQTWEQYEQDFPADNIIRIWKPRVTTFTSLIYTDEDSVATTLSATNYTTDLIDEFRPKIVLKNDYSWPTVILFEANPIKLTFTCGYGSTDDDVPEPIKQAMLLFCSHLYENREMYNISISGNSVVPIPWTMEALIAPYRAWGFDS